MVKISKLFKIAEPYQLNIRGTKRGIELYLVGFGEGRGEVISYEDADRLGNRVFEFVVEGIRKELQNHKECACNKLGEGTKSGMKCSNCGREL